jgi:hypothetical protein
VVALAREFEITIGVKIIVILGFDFAYLLDDSQDYPSSASPHSRQG